MKTYPAIGNISLNYEHWVKKGEDAFIKYYTEKEPMGKALLRQTYAALFARRNDAQQVELLKQHFAIMKSAVNPEKAEPAKAETTKTDNKGAK